jgi:hypothetical protein
MISIVCILLVLVCVEYVSTLATGNCCLARCACDSGNFRDFTLQFRSIQPAFFFLALAGPDDEGGGQKDLNKMCSLPQPSSTCPQDGKYQEIAWNWDTVEFSGNVSVLPPLSSSSHFFRMNRRKFT